MPHNRRPVPENVDTRHSTRSEIDHTHSHSDTCEEDLSAKYEDFIDSHLEQIRGKCKQINTCIDTLLEDENIMVLINGYNLRLNKTCSLVYKSDTETYGNFSKKCTSVDRDNIRKDIEDHLKYHIEGRSSGWKNVRTCLENNFGDMEKPSYVDQICGLAHNRTQICNSAAHRTVEDFVNDQIHHLKCTCRALQTNDGSQFSLPILIGAAVGGVLLLLALFAIGCICYRRRKSRRRKKQVPNVIYVQAPNSDNYPVYQEIFDDRAYQGYSKSPSANPPNLPKRYTTPPSNASILTQMTVREDDHGYLEPVTASSSSRPRLSLPGNTSPDYGAPPEYREKDACGGVDAKNAYVETLPSPAEDENKSYTTLDKNKSDLEPSSSGYSTGETVASYVPKSDSVKLGPVPAKRTKKEDRQAESHYFLLEKDDDNRRENSV